MSLNFKENQISWDNKFIQAYCLNGEKDKYFYFSHANGFNGLTYQSLLQKISSEFKVLKEVLYHDHNAIFVDSENIDEWVSAIEKLQELEDFNRGWYSGAIGWVNLNMDCEFYAGLRSAFIKNNKISD